MKSVLIRIEQYLPNASIAEQGVLKYILSRPDEASHHSINYLSKVSYSSASTIARLCRKIGFEGYRDLQTSLLCELVQRKEKRGTSTIFEPTNQLEEIIINTTQKSILSLENSMHLLDLNVLQKSVAAICNCSRILLFGISASYIVAKDAYLKFLRLNKTCYCSEDIHSQYLYARNATPNDVAIVISYSGYTEEILHCCELLRAQNTPIIAITRFESSPLVQLSTHCLYIANSERMPRAGAMSSRISQLNVVDILYSTYLNRNYDDNTLLLEQTRIAKHRDEE